MTEPTRWPFNVRRRNGTIEMIMKKNVPKLNAKKYCTVYCEDLTLRDCCANSPEFLFSITWEHGWWIADADLEESWPKSTS
jgi:hypothetical protein